MISPKLLTPCQHRPRNVQHDLKQQMLTCFQLTKCLFFPLNLVRNVKIAVPLEVGQFNQPNLHVFRLWEEKHVTVKMCPVSFTWEHPSRPKLSTVSEAAVSLRGITAATEKQSEVVALLKFSRRILITRIPH